jgi:hypothetical protein
VKINKIQIFIMLLVLVIFSLACGFSVSTATITGAYLSANSDGSGQTTVFSGDQTFYCIVEVANAPDDTTLKAVWIAVDVDGVEPNYVIDEASIITNGQNRFTFDLQIDSLWPSGTYKVDIYLNDSLDRTLEFSVN